MRILAVDDEPGILSSLRRELVEHDHEFAGVASAEEGLKLLRGHEQFDIVISDYLMPGIKGIEFLSSVQAIQPYALRILLTGQAPHDLLTKALQAGIVNCHIAKPWNSAILIETISKHEARVHA